MAEPCAQLTVPVAGPFSLAASARFLESFAPAAHDGGRDGHLHLAFPVEGGWTPVGVCVRQPERDGDVAAHVYSAEVADPGTEVADPGTEGADLDAVSAQLAGILSLDVDGTGFAAVGDRDPVIADLQAQMPGFRPVCFFSPYEAACWAIIGQRVRIPQAAGIKRSIAGRYGTTVDIHGQEERSFPPPHRLLEVADDLDSLWPAKQRHLANLAEAALDGDLDAGRLRAMPTDQALKHLQRLPGIGSFSAELILLRGAGHPDHLPTQERRLVDAIGRLYGIAHPTVRSLHDLSEAWRPYRTWCAVLIRAWYEQQRAATSAA